MLLDVLFYFLYVMNNLIINVLQTNETNYVPNAYTN